MRFAVLLAGLPFMAGVFAAPTAEIEIERSEIEARDTSKHYFEVTTWSGGNCRGSSEVGYIEHLTSHCFNIPGASFSGLKTKGSVIPSHCAIHTYSGHGCTGHSEEYTAQNNNLCYPNKHFASYKLQCCREFGCNP